MFLIFLACLTYFWFWLETARLPVCEIQSCDTAVIWVIELGIVCVNWKCLGKFRFFFLFHHHCLMLRSSVDLMSVWHRSITCTSGAAPDESGFIPTRRAWLRKAVQEARPRYRLTIHLWVHVHTCTGVPLPADTKRRVGVSSGVINYSSEYRCVCVRVCASVCCSCILKERG